MVGSYTPLFLLIRWHYNRCCGHHAIFPRLLLQILPRRDRNHYWMSLNHDVVDLPFLLLSSRPSLHHYHMVEITHLSLSDFISKHFKISFFSPSKTPSTFFDKTHLKCVQSLFISHRHCSCLPAIRGNNENACESLY